MANSASNFGMGPPSFSACSLVPWFDSILSDWSCCRIVSQSLNVDKKQLSKQVNKICKWMNLPYQILHLSLQLTVAN